MVDFDTREGIMKEWDKWVKYLRSGGGGTWPRDAFESLLDYLEEQCHLTRSKAAYSCEQSGHVYYWQDGICIKCGAKNPPPA